MKDKTRQHTEQALRIAIEHEMGDELRVVHEHALRVDCPTCAAIIGVPCRFASPRALLYFDLRPGDPLPHLPRYLHGSDDVRYAHNRRREVMMFRALGSADRDLLIQVLTELTNMAAESIGGTDNVRALIARLRR